MPSIATDCWPKSTVPSMSILNASSAASGSGRAALISPRIVSRTGSGTSRITPTSKSSTVGVPQPMDSMGPNRYRPGWAGKKLSMSLTIFGALSMGSAGNRIAFSVCARSPARSASCASVRLTAPRPPTAFSVKPKPSWMGGSSNVMMNSSE